MLFMKFANLDEYDQKTVLEIRKSIRKYKKYEYRYEINKYLFNYLKKHYNVENKSSYGPRHRRMDYIDTYDNEWSYLYVITKKLKNL